MKFTKLSDSNVAAMYAAKSLFREKRVVYEGLDNVAEHAGVIEARARLAIETKETTKDVDAIAASEFIENYVSEVKNREDYKKLHNSQKKRIDAVLITASGTAKNSIDKAKNEAKERIELSGRKFGLELTKQLLEQRKAETEKHEGDFRNEAEDLNFKNNQSIQGVGATLNYAERFTDSNNAVHEINQDQIQTAYTMLLSAIYIEHGKDAAMVKFAELKEQYGLTLEKMKDAFKMMVDDKDTNVMDHCKSLGLTDNPDYSALSGRVWGLIYSGNETFKSDRNKRGGYETYVKGEFTRILDLYKNQATNSQTNEAIYQEILKIKSPTEWNEYANVSSEAMPKEIESESKKLNSRLRGMSLVARNTAREMFRAYLTLGKEKGLVMIHDERMKLAGKGNKLLGLIAAELSSSTEDESIKNEAIAAQNLLDEVTKSIENDSIPRQYRIGNISYMKIEELDNYKAAEFERDKTTELLKVRSMLNMLERYKKAGYAVPTGMNLSASLAQVKAYMGVVNNATDIQTLNSAKSGNVTNLAIIEANIQNLKVEQTRIEIRRTEQNKLDNLRIEARSEISRAVPPDQLKTIRNCKDKELAAKAKLLLEYNRTYWTNLNSIDDVDELEAYIKLQNDQNWLVDQEKAWKDLKDAYEKKYGNLVVGGAAPKRDPTPTSTPAPGEPGPAVPTQKVVILVADKQPPTNGETVPDHTTPATIDTLPNTKERFESKARGAVVNVLAIYRSKGSDELEKVTGQDIINAIIAAAGTPKRGWSGSITAAGIVLEYGDESVVVPSTAVQTQLIAMIAAAKDRETRLAREEGEKDKKEAETRRPRSMSLNSDQKSALRGAINNGRANAYQSQSTMISAINRDIGTAMSGISGSYTFRGITVVFSDGQAVGVSARANSDFANNLSPQYRAAWNLPDRESSEPAGAPPAAGADTRVAVRANRRGRRNTDSGHVVGGTPLPSEGPTGYQKTMSAWQAAEKAFRRSFTTLNQPPRQAAIDAATALNSAAANLTAAEKSSLNGKTIDGGRRTIRLRGNKFVIS